VFLIRTGGPSEDLRDTSQGLLKYLGLMVVPAGVGVVAEFQVLRDNALAIIVSIVVSTLLGLLVTGLLMQWFVGRRADA